MQEAFHIQQGDFEEFLDWSHVHLVEPTPAVSRVIEQLEQVQIGLAEASIEGDGAVVLVLYDER